MNVDKFSKYCSEAEPRIENLLKDGYFLEPVFLFSIMIEEEIRYLLESCKVNDDLGILFLFPLDHGVTYRFRNRDNQRRGMNSIGY